MNKRIAHGLLSLTLLLSLATPAFAEEITPTVEVTVNGETAADFSAAAYGGTTYVPFYFATKALRPDAQIEWVDGRFIAAAEDFTMTARIGDPCLEINGRYLYIPQRIKGEADGTAWVPTRALAAALGAEIGWDGSVLFTTGGAPLSAEARPYDDVTLDLLARAITHESGNQSFEGKMAVGSVILNRVSSPIFPGTVYDVLFQKGQFPGVTDAEPNADSILAARLCLEGANVVPGAYWFNGAGKVCWASRNKTLLAVIDNHAFYG